MVPDERSRRKELDFGGPESGDIASLESQPTEHSRVR